jgi:hypothetical protein
MIFAMAGVTQAAEASSTAANIQWMIARSAIGTINAYVGNSVLTSNAFDTASTLELGNVPTSWVAQKTTSYKSYATFQSAVDAGTVPAGTVYVLYDNENWSATPLIEQQNPAKYEAILAPAQDLAKAMSCYESALTLFANYMRCGIPQLSAQGAPDIFEIQSQSAEDRLSTNCNSDPTSYLCEVSAAVSQAHTVSPALPIWAGLATDHAGIVSTGQNLFTDTMNTEALVGGYWLNLPQKSTECPTCTLDGSPQVAVDYLHLLGYSG